MSVQVHKIKKIFDYSDYRTYLNDTFLELKAKNKKVSLESIAKKTGVSKSYIRFILKAQRHITLDMAPKIGKALKLQKRDLHALTYMVCRDTCQDIENRSFFNEIFQSYQEIGGIAKVKEKLDVSRNPIIFQKSLAMVIHSLSKQSTFQPDVDWIKSRLRNKSISTSEIKSTLDTLLKTKSIVQDQNGRWKPDAFIFNKTTDPVIETFKIYEVGLRAMDPVIANPTTFKPATFHMLSLSFDNDNVDKISQIIRKCRDELVQISQETKDPRFVQVINLNAACFASDN